MKRYLSKQKTGNLCIILYPSNLLLAIILLICTIFRALLTFLCILISQEIIMTVFKTKKMPKIDTLDALEEHEEHEDDYQTNSN